MIQLTSVSLRRGTKLLVEQASATIYPGQRFALIGRNGCGKSSLFALLRKELEVDEGDVAVPTQWRMVSVAQETPGTDRQALEYVIDGDKHLRNLEHQLSRAENSDDGDQIAHLHAQLAEAGQYDVKARASTILAGLGFSENQLSQPVSAFSGGWRMRLNLAQALLCPSDCLLLDEPTNHLDLDAVIWLEKWLQRYAGTLLVISHDKAFIDSVADHVLSVEQRNLVTYSGNYSSYEKQKAERLRQQDIQYQKQQQTIEHLNQFIRRFKAKASKAKQAQSRIKQLEKMEQLAPAHADSPFSFAFRSAGVIPSPLIGIDNVKLGYGEKTILHNVKLNLVPGSRIGLLGKNGQGKSTLIKMLAGELAVQSGDFTIAKGSRIGYFAQHQLEMLDADASPLLHLQRIDSKATEQQLRDYLGGFNFQGDAATGLVAPMSGGEKARLVLAILVYQKPNLLLLDEPTNHLDLDMRHALSMALQEFEGAMVLVSHDRFLLEGVCEDFYLVNDGQVQRFDGDLDDYKRWILQQQGESTSTTPSNPSKETTSASQPVDRKQEKRLQAEFRARLKPFKAALQQSENKMEKLTSELDKVESTLTDTELYEAENKAQLTQVLAQQASLKQQLEEAELAWFDAQAALDEAQASYEDGLNA